MARMPTLFISHGSPLLAVVDSAARRFLKELGPRLPAPTAVVVGFGSLRYADHRGHRRRAARDDSRLRRFSRRALSLALSRARQSRARARHRRLARTRRVARAARAAPRSRSRRLDTLVVDVPARRRARVADIDRHARARRSSTSPWAARCARCATPARWCLGSGGATHNLALYAHARGRDDDSAPPEWVEAFNEWTAGAIAARRFDDLFRYCRARAVRGAESPDGRALSAVVRDARRGLRRRARRAHPRELRPRAAVARCLCVRARAPVPREIRRSRGCGGAAVLH